jgi:hypothetical protein
LLAISSYRVFAVLFNKPLKADGRTSSPPAPSCLSPVVKYHGLARRYVLPPRFLMRPLLNGGTLD